jgi:Lon-like ATP-dependent protease
MQLVPLHSGVGESESNITDGAMTNLIEDYCREAGVRNLQKHLEKIYRKVALKLAKSKGAEVGLHKLSSVNPLSCIHNRGQLG